eukprot:CAMPEP_0179905180 /NCGR_PEP_ID=MMETSP0982-20121206/42440_1 /TAXON_ID=483367 /ORGANISM="non described non described, Strain CCMP 2436" /LENGTH=75 /DNA_ID=CAMNT_0021805337 /DNA_START=506 /DNA_END=736 /DNA_ORIENTATION=+
MIANNVPNVVSRAERGASPTDSRATPTTTTAVPANAPALHQMVRQGSLMLSTGFVRSAAHTGVSAVKASTFALVA